ncbi:MAG: AmmeMemoRadiSam system protein A [Candidatus Aminicenantes bacterium]|nr:AmmeMemoRadiSam system protein A [Candidatus Aminicenantes bacterium]
MPEELTDAQQREFLGLARDAVRRLVENRERPAPSARDPQLKAKRGVFVTLKVGGRLRGCIGHPLPVKPLDEAVVEVAEAAASEDFRFEPLRPDELDRLRIEISVLSLPRRLKDFRSLEIGRHGIIVAQGTRKGLLLPQVPVEYGWDRETFLRHGCLKAGLDEDAWKTGATVDVFTAQVFSEEEKPERRPI